MAFSHGTSRQTAFQSLSKRHSIGGTHEKPHSSSATRSDGTRSKTPSATRLITCPWAIDCELAR
jgi:hypothetical protein